MKNQTSSYCGYRFPIKSIKHSIWLYHRFRFSFRVVEDLLAERDNIVTFETIPRCCQKLDLPWHCQLNKNWTLNLLITWQFSTGYRSRLPAPCISGNKFSLRWLYPKKQSTLKLLKWSPSMSFTFCLIHERPGWGIVFTFFTLLPAAELEDKNSASQKQRHHIGND